MYYTNTVLQTVQRSGMCSNVCGAVQYKKVIDIDLSLCYSLTHSPSNLRILNILSHTADVLVKLYSTILPQFFFVATENEESPQNLSEEIIYK